MAGIPAVIEEVRSGGDNRTYYYYRDPNGALIARRDASDASSLQYYHYDELGSTRLITNASGEVTDEYIYDPYGSVIAHTGTTFDNPYQYVGALGYYTHHQAPEFKLLQVGFRFYDPETSRFTQLDPIGDGINWYAYCAGNPMAYVDPWGLYIESGLDCAGLALDVYDFKKKPTLLGGAIIVGDIAAIALPVIPSIGAGRLAYKAATHADDFGHVVKRGARNRKVAKALKNGQKAHREYTEEMRSRGLRANQTIPGTKLRPDGLDPVNGVIYELKPKSWLNNPKYETRLQDQLRRYEEAARQVPEWQHITEWKRVIDYY